MSDDARESDEAVAQRLRRSPDVIAFVEAARFYCAWAEADPQDAWTEVLQALRILSAVQHSALALSREPAAAHAEAPERDLPDGAGAKKARRFASLPFQYYQGFSDPANLDQESGIGDLREDLAEVWSDLATGFLHWDRGEVIDAVFHWTITFQGHWGRHASEAMWTLHAWFDSGDGRWTSPPV